mmetsp:Transcript_13291/g.33705  ORF Transcript_13291/g.33705 Transcript_13291/m.33705 type:complete len:362 (-) Transcript_13291:362-1447(-)
MTARASQRELKAVTSLAANPETAPPPAPKKVPKAKIERPAAALVSPRPKDVPRQLAANSGAKLDAGRKPVLFYEVYGSSFGLDLFACPHNAVRRELSDLYDVVHAMTKLNLKLTTEDVDSFFRWWAQFRNFLYAVFEVEESVYYPWITSADSLAMDTISSAERIAMKKKVVEGIKAIDKYKAEKLKEPGIMPYQRVAKIVDLADKFSAPLLQYFYNEERTLPSIIEKHFKPSDKIKIDKKTYKFLEEESVYDYETILVLWTDWMKENQLNEWIDAYAGKNIVKKQDFQRARHSTEMSHGKTIETLMKKADIKRVHPMPAMASSVQGTKGGSMGVSSVNKRVLSAQDKKSFGSSMTALFAKK